MTYGKSNLDCSCKMELSSQVNRLGMHANKKILVLFWQEWSRQKWSRLEIERAYALVFQAGFSRNRHSYLHWAKLARHLQLPYLFLEGHDLGRGSFLQLRET